MPSSDHFHTGNVWDGFKASLPHDPQIHILLLVSFRCQAQKISSSCILCHFIRTGWFSGCQSVFTSVTHGCLFDAGVKILREPMKFLTSGQRMAVHQEVFTLGDARSFLALTSKILLLGSMLKFNADVKTRSSAQGNCSAKSLAVNFIDSSLSTFSVAIGWGGGSGQGWRGSSRLLLTRRTRKNQ